MSREPYLEHCPECTQAVKCRPIHLFDDHHDGVIATYRCRICRHAWRTSWQREPEMEMTY